MKNNNAYQEYISMLQENSLKILKNAEDTQDAHTQNLSIFGENEQISQFSKFPQINKQEKNSSAFNSEHLYAEYAQSAELSKKINFAYSADIAYIENKIKSYGLTLNQLKDFLGEDWELYKDNPEALTGWADLLNERQQMEHGQVPKDFTAITHCASCGDVFVPPALANNGSVYGCPWCLNNAKGLPIPNAKINKDLSLKNQRRENQSRNLSKNPKIKECLRCYQKLNSEQQKCACGYIFQKPKFNTEKTKLSFQRYAEIMKRQYGEEYYQRIMKIWYEHQQRSNS